MYKIISLSFLSFFFINFSNSMNTVDAATMDTATISRLKQGRKIIITTTNSQGGIIQQWKRWDCHDPIERFGIVWLYKHDVYFEDLVNNGRPIYMTGTLLSWKSSVLLIGVASVCGALYMKKIIEYAKVK